MFNQAVDDRLTEWANHRRKLDEADDPLQEVWDFWHQAPFTPHNRNVDPYYQQSWPAHRSHCTISWHPCPGRRYPSNFMTKISDHSPIFFDLDGATLLGGKGSPLTPLSRDK